MCQIEGKHRDLGVVQNQGPGLPKCVCQLPKRKRQLAVWQSRTIVGLDLLHLSSLLETENILANKTQVLSSRNLQSVNNTGKTGALWICNGKCGIGWKCRASGEGTKASRTLLGRQRQDLKQGFMWTPLPLVPHRCAGIPSPMCYRFLISVSNSFNDPQVFRQRDCVVRLKWGSAGWATVTGKR